MVFQESRLLPLTFSMRVVIKTDDRERALARILAKHIISDLGFSAPAFVIIQCCLNTIISVRYRAWLQFPRFSYLQIYR